MNETARHLVISDAQHGNLWPVESWIITQLFDQREAKANVKSLWKSASILKHVNRMRWSRQNVNLA